MEDWYFGQGQWFKVKIVLKMIFLLLLLLQTQLFDSQDIN